MMMDRYGNYVIQRMLEICSPEQKQEVTRRFQQGGSQILKTSSYGKHIMTQLGLDV